MDTKTYSRIVWFAVLLIALVNVCLPLTNGKLVSGHDTQRYIPRLVEFHENIRHGNLIPRWAPDLILGQGQPLFMFSPPLPYYIAEIWQLLGFDSLGALNWASITMILISAFSMFLLCSLYFGERGGVLGALAYVYSPYFHVDLYVRGAYSEFSAMAFYPLALYGWARYSIEKDRRALALGIVAFAAVTLSHNPTALLFAPVIVAFAIFQAVDQRSWRMLAWQIAALAVAVAISAFFWLPALLEIGNVHGERLVGGYFDYKMHFVELRQLVSTFWGYGGSVPGPDDQMSLSLGWSHVLLGLVALGASIALSSSARRVQGFFAAALVGLCVLMLPISAAIWEAVPLLQFIQFPWRLLGPASVCLCVIVASLGAIGYAENVRVTVIAALAVLMLLVPNWHHAAPNAYVALRPEDWTPEALARRGVETTAQREFETKWVQRVLPYDPERFRTVSGDAIVVARDIGPTSWSAAATANVSSVVEARLLYFPGWRVLSEGIETPVTIAPETGRIRFDVLAGTHEIRIELERTEPVLLGNLLSIAGVGVLGLFLVRKRKSYGV